MKKNRSLSGIFLSVLLTFILCFTTGATAFAEGIQTDGDQIEEQAVTVAEGQKQQACDPAEPPLTESGDRQEESVRESGSSVEGMIAAGTENPVDIPMDEESQENGEESGGQDSSPAIDETAEPESSETAGMEETETEEAETEESQTGESGTADVETDPEDDTDGMIAMIREEYGTEAAEIFGRMLNNASVKALVAAIDEALKAEFPGMTDEEIALMIDSMSDEEAEALMERILGDPLISGLLEAVASDEELTEDMDSLMNIIFADEDIEDLPGKLEKAVQGTQGDNVSWVLTTDGTLTISGRGTIVPDYEDFLGEKIATYGWDDYIDYAAKIVIRDGITNVPEGAFAYSVSLKTAIIPASVTSIESAAFAGCAKLTAVYFLGNAPEIAADAFDDCSEELTLYHLEGTTGWDKVKGYRLSVWKAASSSEESSAKEGSETVSKASAADRNTEAESSSEGTPGTGDTADIYPFVILMAAALICGGVIVIRMRRKG